MTTERTVTEGELPDGSTWRVCPVDYRSSLIERRVEGVCVWGQSFGLDTAERHAAQVERVLAGMREAPGGYDRRVLWDHEGKAAR